MPANLPRVDLLGSPTPFEPMRRAGAALGHSGLWIKRDDCMALGMGGNKVRSLEYWLGAALARDCDMVVVAGAPASNQCRLTAAAAARLGLSALVLYAGDAGAPLHANAALTRLFGAEIRWLGPLSEEERGERAEAAIKELRATGRRPCLIGDPAIGALGYARAAGELAAQADAAGVALRHVVLPGSMGVTEAGLMLGASRLGLPWRFHLISVEYGANELRRRLSRILAEAGALLGHEPSDLAATAIIHVDQLGEGYDHPTAEADKAARFFAGTEALVIERTYVAKTFAGLARLVADGAIPPDEAACVLHTGGNPAFFSQAPAAG